MKRRPKVVVVMPAYNAQKTLKDAYNRLPHALIDEVILIDDGSHDQTFLHAKKLPIITFKNSINLGYGGNLKMCFIKALERGADIIIEYHPDNQYDPASLPGFLQKAREGYDLAIGSRFIHPKEALDRKMPLYKFIANRSLSFIDQLVLGLELSEFHSGFRMYTRKLLETVPFLQTSDDYLFSFEIIVQAVYFKFKVAEVKISCDYHPKMHTADFKRSTIYALGTFKTLAQYVVSKFWHKPNGPFIQRKKLPACPLCKQHFNQMLYHVTDPVSHENFSIHFCTPCQIAFTHPQPDNMSRYYTDTYYSPWKAKLYKHLQFRRPTLIRQLLKQGKILDIGCGEGIIREQLDTKRFTYTGIETPFTQQRQSYIKYVGIEGMKEKPNTYDIVTFWESFEHLKDLKLAVEKSVKALKPGGYLVIECPNFSAWERFIFHSRWFHLDPPRHFFHLTPRGITHLLQQAGFQNIKNTPLYAPEYIAIGLAHSFAYLFSPKMNLFTKKKHLMTSLAIAAFIVGVSVCMIPISLVAFVFRGSPIMLTIAQKKG